MAKVREWHRFLNDLWMYLRGRAAREKTTPFEEAFRSVRTHRIHPEPLVARLCWFVFLDNQPSRGVEWIASGVGHDWRSLKNLRSRLDKFLAERRGLEALTGRTLDFFRSRAEKLKRETDKVNPSALLASNIFQGSSSTLEDRSRLLQETVPTRITSYLEQFREGQGSESENALAWLVDHGISYSDITELLNATAKALGVQSDYDPDALKMRAWRSRKPL